MLGSRPHLSVNMAMTLDGKVMRPDGKWYGLSSRADRERMDVYRLEADALIVGRNSIDRDDPVVVPRREGRIPVPVMICRTALPAHSRHIFSQDTVRVVIFTTPQLAGYGTASGLYENVDFIGIPPDQLLPEVVLAALADRGFDRILLEGGPRLNHAFFAADLVDTLYVTLVPYVIGQSELPGIVDGSEPFSGFDQRHWHLVRSDAVQDEVFLEYARRP